MFQEAEEYAKVKQLAYVTTGMRIFSTVVKKLFLLDLLLVTLEKCS